MAAAAETVQRDEHGLGVVRGDALPFVVSEVGSAWRKHVVRFLRLGLRDEVDGEGAGEFGIGGAEDPAFVDDWRAGGFHNSPGGLQVSVEEEGV